MPTRRTGVGQQTVEVPPAACPNGHELAYPNVQHFYLPCGCAGGRGHRGTRCWTCSAVIYEPAHDESTAPMTGRWTR